MEEAMGPFLLGDIDLLPAGQDEDEGHGSSMNDLTFFIEFTLLKAL